MHLAFCHSIWFRNLFKTLILNGFSNEPINIMNTYITDTGKGMWKTSIIWQGLFYNMNMVLHQSGCSNVFLAYQVPGAEETGNKYPILCFEKSVQTLFDRFFPKSWKSIIVRSKLNRGIFRFIFLKSYCNELSKTPLTLIEPIYIELCEVEIFSKQIIHIWDFLKCRILYWYATWLDCIPFDAILCPYQLRS